MSLSIDARLADAAAAKGIDLPQLLEEALLRRLKSEAGGGLSEGDRKAIDFHNRYEAKHGRWTDGLE